MQRYRVLPSIRLMQCINIHPKAAEELGISMRKICFLRFGIICTEVKVNITDDININEIVLDEETITHLNIPLSINYEIKATDFEIIIGPYIGLLIHKKQDTLDKYINAYKNYLTDYKSIGGAVIVFSVEGINQGSETVNGYLYNPINEEWVKGTYAYPTALFKRIGINKSLRNHLHEKLGNAIFNEYILNKWEMYDWLSATPELRCHLPESILYKGQRDLLLFLTLHQIAYLKPISGSQGKGIIEIKNDGIKYYVNFIEQKKCIEKEFYTVLDACIFINQLINHRRYIIQSGIKLIQTEGCKHDFRILVLKDDDGRWQDYGLVVRTGVKGSILSNISSGGIAEKGEQFLKQLELNAGEIFDLKYNMTRIALEVANTIQKCGIHCGNLGIDMGIDTNGYIWIIEVNSLDPNHTILLDAKLPQQFYLVKNANMLYAKKLAGFGSGE